MNKRLANPGSFAPPSPQQMEAHLLRTSPREPSRLWMWLPLAVLTGSAALVVVAEQGSLQVLAWALLATVFVSLGVRARRLMDLQQEVGRVQELAMLRRFPQALRRGWRVLGKVRSPPELHARIVALLSHCLDEVRAYESAIVGYDFLIDRLPRDHPGSVQLTLQRALAQLATGQLTDADDALRRLRPMVGQRAGSPIGAAYQLVELVQRVRTNHFADAVAQADGLVDALRALGVEAGYGHGLMALCYYRLEPQGSGSDASPTALWWSRATALLEPGALVHHFPELAVVASHFHRSADWRRSESS